MDRIDVTHAEIEQFLYHEAYLIDSWRLEEWLALFTEDCRYWVPCNTDDQNPETETSLIYDDHTALEDRLWRLSSPKAHSQVPRSRTIHIISNIKVEPPESQTLRVYSNFIISETRLRDQRTFAGRYEHLLRRGNHSWKIALKKASLINNDIPLINLTFLI